MKVKVNLNKKEIEEIISYYFQQHRNVDEPSVYVSKTGDIEVSYVDYSIEDGHL